MQARSSIDGSLYTWTTGSVDFSGAGFPGPGVANDIAVAMRPTTSGSGGSGDVLGLGSSVAHRLAGFANTGGKQLEQTSFLAADVLLRTGAVPLTGDLDFGTRKATNAADAVASTGLTTLQQVNALIAAAIAGAGGGGGDGFVFTFSATTADADPGAGTLRLNSATPASISQIFLDLTDTSSNDLTAWIDRLDDSIGSVKGYIRVGSRSDKTKWLLFSLASVTTATGYRKLGVTYVAGTSVPLTTAGDTFLSFESMGLIGLITNALIDPAAGIALSKLAIGTALYQARMNTGGTSWEAFRASIAAIASGDLTRDIVELWLDNGFGVQKATRNTRRKYTPATTAQETALSIVMSADAFFDISIRWSGKKQSTSDRACRVSTFQVRRIGSAAPAIVSGTNIDLVALWKDVAGWGTTGEITYTLNAGTNAIDISVRSPTDVDWTIDVEWNELP